MQRKGKESREESNQPTHPPTPTPHPPPPPHQTRRTLQFAQEIGLAPPKKESTDAWGKIQNDKTYFENSIQTIEAQRQSSGTDKSNEDEEDAREDLPPIIRDESEVTWEKTHYEIGYFGMALGTMVFIILGVLAYWSLNYTNFSVLSVTTRIANDVLTQSRSFVSDFTILAFVSSWLLVLLVGRAI